MPEVLARDRIIRRALCSLCLVLDDLTSWRDTMADRLKLHFVMFAAPTGSAVQSTVYRPYLLVASPWLQPDSGIATVVPLHGGSPVPDQIHFVSPTGGAASALRAARDAIVALPENNALLTIPASLEDFEEW